MTREDELKNIGVWNLEARLHELKNELKLYYECPSATHLRRSSIVAAGLLAEIRELSNVADRIERGRA